MDGYDAVKIIETIKEIHGRISGHILFTPLLYSRWLSTVTGCNIYFKMESEQVTGSFKLRGAANKTLILHKQQQEHNGKEKIITASSGNHGLAVAHMTSKFDIPLVVYLYETVPAIKQASLKQFKNVEVVKKGEECCQAELFAKQHANEANLIYVSPYNDLDVMFGQGTIGLELLNQLNDVDAVFVPVGGGGLIGGISAYIKSMKPSVKIVGCQPKLDCCMYESIKAGRIVDDNLMQETFADGVAGRIETNSVTFDFCRRFVDEWVLLSEEEIERAVFDMIDKEKKMVEGAAGLAIAGVQRLKDQFKNKNVVVLICGGAIGVNKLNYVLTKYSG